MQMPKLQVWKTQLQREDSSVAFVFGPPQRHHSRSLGKQPSFFGHLQTRTHVPESIEILQQSQLLVDRRVSVVAGTMVSM